MPNTSSIKTGKVLGRRTLHFTTIDQALAEADRLAVADRANKAQSLGNWTLGQTLNHLASWAQFSYDGIPMNTPFFIRWILRTRKNSFLHKPMRPGVRIPSLPEGTLATNPAPLEDALKQYHQVMTRLKTEPPTIRHQLFGIMTHEEWIALNLRHAELHLSFITDA
jgi:hypothetical protein